ncbi:hypothetical protein TD95_001485 [Thielaviopsis punctulata]|uniref:EamA domain-containing protein n=1 Tax=Thielaviopsis punctulata TaxID=72032 RepID=A0A0F4ZH26_9PEZI|nr:hypothetical protein TD95_001485 [Thielaviopsis punctulata]
MGWITLAVASGIVAAINSVSTNNLTEKLAMGAAGMFGLTGNSKYFEILLRIIFFIFNIFFNGVMWSLFTRALTIGSSTTKTSMVNTSANFMATAVFGAIIFAETLPPLWFLGASLLVVGNVIIGHQDEGSSAVDNSSGVRDADHDVGDTPLQTYGEVDGERYRDDVDYEREGGYSDEDVPHLADMGSHVHKL